jgi:hypothetical protein
MMNILDVHSTIDLLMIFLRFFCDFLSTLEAGSRNWTDFLKKGPMLDVFPDRKSKNGFRQKTGKWPILGSSLNRDYQGAFPKQQRETYVMHRAKLLQEQIG